MQAREDPNTNGDCGSVHFPFSAAKFTKRQARMRLHAAALRRVWPQSLC
jgi:hypothetical protein